MSVTTRLMSLYDAGTAALQQGRLDDALSLLQRVVDRAEDQNLGALAWANLGVGLRRQGRQDEARAAFEEALKRDPSSITAMFNLANTLLALGKLPEALKHYTALRTLAPDRGDVANNMGAVLMALGRYEDAVNSFSEAVRIDSQDAQAWGNLGSAQAASGQMLAPLRTLHKALQLDPQSVSNHIKLGHLLTEQGHFTPALKAFKAARKLAPDRLDAQVGLAQVNHRLGNTEEAYKHLAPLIGEGKTSPNLAATWAQVCRRTGRHEEAIPTLQTQISAAAQPATLSLLLHNLGDLLDGLGRHEQAFEAYDRANKLRELHHDPAAHSAWVDQLIAQPLPSTQATCTSQVPVFIVGMPRSGTSLVEQILASHPEVYGAGELDEIRQLTLMYSHQQETPYPQSLERLTPRQLDHMAGIYLKRLQRSDTDALRVTDKMPQNFLYLGLVAAMLPEARVIHCTRDPADTGLSCFFQNFKDTLAFATDQRWIARWTRDYQRLMAHWKAKLPLPILDIPYEALCEDPESWSRKIVEFSGLSWDAQCLQAHLHSRVVRTASYAQVRTPIYKTSIGRAEHYAPHIPELLELRNTAKSRISSIDSDQHPKTLRTGG